MIARGSLFAFRVFEVSRRGRPFAKEAELDRTNEGILSDPLSLHGGVGAILDPK